MSSLGAYNALEWTKQLKEMNLKTFMFQELPAHLHIRKHLHKAESCNYIKCIGKEYRGSQPRKIYEICERIDNARGLIMRVIAAEGTHETYNHSHFNFYRNRINRTCSDGYSIC